MALKAPVSPVIYLISLVYGLDCFHAEYEQASSRAVLSFNFVIGGYYKNCHTDGLMDTHPLQRIIATSACFKKMIWVDLGPVKKSFKYVFCKIIIIFSCGYDSRTIIFLKIF